MKTFKNYKDIEFFCLIMVEQGTHKKALLNWVENKIIEGILSPEKLTVHLFSLLPTFEGSLIKQNK